MDEHTTILIRTFAQIWQPFFVSIFVLVFILMLRDWTNSFAKGLYFKLASTFKAGDAVIIDDEEAVVTTVGFTTTRFTIRKPDGKMAWRFVQNDQLYKLKIEKIVWDPINRSKPQDD